MQRSPVRAAWLLAVAASFLWFATLAVALRFLREPGRDRAIGAAVKLGLVVALLSWGGAGDQRRGGYALD